jgi:hypothetical protein
MKTELEEAAKEFVLSHDFSQLTNPNHLANRCFQLGAKWQKEQNDTSKVNRIEVIQHSEPYNGRAYTNYNVNNVDIQIQDDGKTLKIFLK